MLAFRRPRSHRTIRPARSRSRSARAAAAWASLPVVVLVVLLASGRRADRVVTLEPSGPWRYASGAGPVEVTRGPTPHLEYQGSWLFRGPDLGDDRWPGRLPAADLRLDCDTRWPCRAVSRLQIPDGGSIEVHSSGGEVHIGPLTASVVAVATAAHPVFLGAVGGTVRVETVGGQVVGSGLTAAEVEVTTADGTVELSFAEPPRDVSIDSGSAPVTIELPPGRYAVSVEGDPSPTIEVGHDRTAERRIRVDGHGPVRILHAS